MTTEEILGPVILPVSLAIAFVATALMLLHVARRYPTSPKNVPLSLRFDGRPRRLVPKLVLWLAPIVLTLAVAFVGVMLVAAPVPDDQRTATALVFIIFAECAALVAWSTDRQIELARKQTFRIAPARTLLVTLPLLATVAILIAITVHTSS